MLALLVVPGNPGRYGPEKCLPVCNSESDIRPRQAADDSARIRVVVEKPSELGGDVATLHSQPVQGFGQLGGKLVRVVQVFDVRFVDRRE